ncbi:winged helix-turn-helix transcriptional regulator [Tsukamurella paurometabola]|uniref:HTH-type transcriptional activator hxlR n=1 Tax=Tsukamurella paurometabola TaxID=2061 RepID=A0A3P8KI47_TSUPA|nr:helix-turn-helix domain-containing protein [Tsukamurella paurometabola]UEA82882.1 helix-turn-helix transcriptional regulator [Tsukamurella paurometabola]VDR39958.1 HTH-type transcriptional activator hxlR [Tsukamurella paurometabola]
MVEKVNPPKRSYGQFCALARALDVIGDRWTLLIVRELLPGAMRYGELRTSLAGIATNLLADRLRGLEADGIVERHIGDAGVVYRLTPRGAALREPMEALGRWGVPLLASGRGDDAFQPRWLTLAVPALLRGRTASPAVEAGVEVEGFLMTVRIDETGPSAFVPAERPRTVLTASPDVLVCLATGTVSAEEAIELGELEGDPAPLRSVFAPSP